MKPGHSERSLYWFSEGFTEYYSIALSRRSDLITDDDYVGQVNEILKQYYTSSVRNVPNSKIEKDFWTDSSLIRLPYLRGFLLAEFWDQKIKIASGNRHSLDDVMRCIFDKAQKNKGIFFQEDIEEVVAKFLSGAKQDIETYIINGEMIVPKEKAYGNAYNLEWVDQKDQSIPQYCKIGN